AVTSDGGHRALVDVAEWYPRAAEHVLADVLGDVAAALHGELGHAGQRRSVLGLRDEIAGHEDLGAIWHREIVLDPDAPGAIERHTEVAGQRAGPHAGGPHDGACGDGLSPDLDELRPVTGPTRVY